MKKQTLQKIDKFLREHHRRRSLERNVKYISLIGGGGEVSSGRVS
jgi:hypothetical protein